MAFHETGPLLCPEVLLGIDEVPEETRVGIADHLERVVNARGGILHACSAFNSLYFGYDPVLRRYTMEPDPAAFLEVTIGGALPVLPTGAFVRLTRGTRELWGEVAAIFGCREGAEQDGWTAAFLSGAPADGEVDEQRLMVDTGVFGPLSPDEAVERGRWLRPGGGFERGHLVGPVSAVVADVASRDQIGSFAAFLASAGRDLLALGPLPRWLGRDADTEVFARAVRAAVTCVADIMASNSAIRMWGLYGRSAAAAEAFVDSACAREIKAMVSRPAPGGVARYSALWPLLENLTDRGDEDRPESLTGVAGAALVVDANLALADAVVGGQYRDGIDLRIDDQWQQGGIWRSQRLPVSALLTGLDPLTPAGIGFAETGAGNAADGLSEAGTDRTEISRVHVEHIDDELVVFTVALSAADLSAGRLELTQPVKQLLPSGAAILQLHHDGANLPNSAAVQQVRPSRSGVSGVVWPPTVYPGLRLTVAAARAGRRLVATSVRLPEPVPVEGFGAVEWECDWELFTQELDVAGPSLCPSERERWQPSVARGAWRPAVASLEQLVIEALKRDGDTGPVGTRALDGRRLTASLFGPDVRSPALLWTVIHTCEDMAVLGMLTQAASPGGGPNVFTWWPDTPQAWEAREAGAWGDGDGLLQKMKNRHWVRPRERRLPTGQQATPTSREAYARWRLEVEGSDADIELPAGMTFVHGHLRGTGSGKPWHRHVPQRQEGRFENG
ncbi:hypothetical protein [Streptomyces cucumeris]|uniref:hypothetical protein n=1 Tax=Streptomyces cucumeris TaxID=2962890 RepID=UPI003EBEB5ED